MLVNSSELYGGRLTWLLDGISEHMPFLHDPDTHAKAPLENKAATTDRTTNRL